MTVPLRTATKDGAPEVLPGIRRRANRQARTAMALFLAAVLLAGCAAGPELDEATAGKFQARVASAKQLAADQNFPGALAELDQLSREVGEGAEQGAVSPERRSRIDSSILKVRADLEAARAAAQPKPTPTTAAPEPPPGGGDGEEKDKDDDGGGGKEENKGKGKDD